MNLRYVSPIYVFLTSCASQQKFTYYEEVAHVIGLETDRRTHRDILNESFSEINRKLNAIGLPMLTAIISEKGAFKRKQPFPSSGFFTCARDELHYIIADEAQFYMDQLQRIFAVQQWP